MAKRHRTATRPARQKAAGPRRPASVPKASGPVKTGPRKKSRPDAAAAVTPPKRSSYIEAVALYERGIQALQKHEYARAAELLAAVIERFPEERELHERARLYLKVCERQRAGTAPAPKTLQERMYAATVALNAGRYKDALVHLEAVNQEDPQNDYVEYMLAAAYSLQGQSEAGLTHLRRAIELNPENRALARSDGDLEGLRSHDGFRTTLEIPAPAGTRRRSRARAR